MGVDELKYCGDQEDPTWDETFAQQTAQAFQGFVIRAEQQDDPCTTWTDPITARAARRRQRVSHQAQQSR